MNASRSAVDNPGGGSRRWPRGSSVAVAAADLRGIQARLGQFWRVRQNWPGGVADLSADVGSYGAETDPRRNLRGADFFSTRPPALGPYGRERRGGRTRLDPGIPPVPELRNAWPAKASEWPTSAGRSARTVSWSFHGERMAAPEKGYGDQDPTCNYRRFRRARHGRAGRRRPCRRMSRYVAPKSAGRANEHSSAIGRRNRLVQLCPEQFGQRLHTSRTRRRD
jgi:hypothetical protein